MKILIAFIRNIARLQLTDQGYVKAVLVVDAKGNPRGVVVTEGFEPDKFVEKAQPIAFPHDPSVTVMDSGKLP